MLLPNAQSLLQGVRVIGEIRDVEGHSAGCGCVNGPESRVLYDLAGAVEHHGLAIDADSIYSKAHLLNVASIGISVVQYSSSITARPARTGHRRQLRNAYIIFVVKRHRRNDHP